MNPVKKICLNFYDKYIIKSRTKTKKQQEKVYSKRYIKNPLTEEQKQRIDDFYLANYGKKVSHVWHQYYTADSKKFDVKYFPEDLYIPKFEHFMNEQTEYCKVFEDKNLLKLLGKSAEVKTPETIISCSDGIYQDKDNNIISLKEVISCLKNVNQKVFIKPSKDSYGGKNCVLLNLSKNDLDIEKIIKEYGNNFVIQKPIKTCKALSDIHPSSVNTFRIITYIWNNKIYKTKANIRVGVGGSVVDNASSGGFSVGITDEGILQPFGIYESGKRIYVHPDTGIKFENYYIPHVNKVFKAAEKLHKHIPQIGIINWDFTLDENNDPLLIEMNIRGGSIDMCQKTHGEGAFGNNTEEILQWIKKMEKLNKVQRLSLKK